MWVLYFCVRYPSLVKFHLMCAKSVQQRRPEQVLDYPYTLIGYFISYTLLVPNLELVWLSECRMYIFFFSFLFFLFLFFFQKKKICIKNILNKSSFSKNQYEIETKALKSSWQSAVTSSISKTFSPRELLISGYFLFLGTCSVNQRDGCKKIPVFQLFYSDQHLQDQQPFKVNLNNHSSQLTSVCPIARFAQSTSILSIARMNFQGSCAHLSVVKPNSRL